MRLKTLISPISKVKYIIRKYFKSPERLIEGRKYEIRAEWQYDIFPDACTGNTTTIYIPGD